ncbi:MAG: rhomboid family intramembrane serine protease [Phycisphaerales bacterium]
MLIPLGTDRPLMRGTLITYFLLGVTVAMFLVQVVGQTAYAEQWRPIERELLIWGKDFKWWNLFSHAFLHGSWWHLAGNMAFLWVFGPNIEDRFGRIGFFLFYLAGAAAAGGLHAAFSPNPALGASGAIAACTGAYMIMFPRAMVKVFALFFVIGIVHMPAWWLIGLSIVWDIVSQASGARGVAHMAHLGGYMFGIGLSFGLLWAKVLPREPYDVFSLVRQRYRREQIRQAVAGKERADSQRWERARGAPSPGGSAAKPSAAEIARTQALAAARAEVSRLVGAGEIDRAAAAYKALAEQHAAANGATVLSRRCMYDLANHYLKTGDHRAAVYAYERFLEGYPTDPEAPQVRLLLGKVSARYLNDPVRAKALILEAMGGLRDDQSREMARRELEALG